MEEAIKERKFIFEFIDEEGNYIKSQGREIEQIGFFLRFIHEHFIPCKECQKKLLKQIKNTSTITLGNKEYEPPLELWKKDEIDDDAWETIEKHKATKEEFQKYKKGITTYV